MQRLEDCIWLLLGARGGDNAQIRALAEQLGLPREEKQLTYNAAYMLPNLLKGASLFSLRARAYATIKPPWPRMVIAVGKRSVPVARYIKQQSGGRTRLIQLGRPRANPDHFDLVVTTPQYGLPSNERVVELPVPLSPLLNMDVEQTLHAHEQLGAEKPRPFVVMVAGGDSSTARFTIQAAQKLARLGKIRAQKCGGSLFALTSPRTPVRVIETLQNELAGPATFIEWKKSDDRRSDSYTALLALADEIIVTSDSASMIGDGLALGKPLRIFQLPAGWQSRFSSTISAVIMRLDRLSEGSSPVILLLAPWRSLRKSGLINPPRSMARLIDGLFQNSLAAPFPAPEGEPPEPSKSPEIQASFAHTITRIRLLLKD